MSLKKELLRRGNWTIEYRSGYYCCEWALSGATIMVLDNSIYGSGERRHWHMRRFWGRNRTSTECVALALQWVLEREAEAQREQLEATIAAEEANALAEFAKEWEPIL